MKQFKITYIVKGPLGLKEIPNDSLATAENMRPVLAALAEKLPFAVDNDLRLRTVGVRIEEVMDAENGVV